MFKFYTLYINDVPKNFLKFGVARRESFRDLNRACIYVRTRLGIIITFQVLIGELCEF